jgi:phytoene synthase
MTRAEGRQAGGVAAFVRHHDPDRFLTALFAPPEKREALLCLYAFNHELARAREVVSQPPLALIRLEWWREVVEGARRQHEVAAPLLDCIAAGRLQQHDLLAMIDAREAEAEPGFVTVQDWRNYVFNSAGGVAVAAGRLLDAPEPERLRPLGAAYGIAGLLRSEAVHARHGRRLLPPGLSSQQIAAEGLALLRPLRLPRHAIAAALPAVLARRDLTRVPAIRMHRGFGDRLAVVLAGLAGRV